MSSILRASSTNTLPEICFLHIRVFPLLDISGELSGTYLALQLSGQLSVQLAVQRSVQSAVQPAVQLAVLAAEHVTLQGATQAPARGDLQPAGPPARKLAQEPAGDAHLYATHTPCVPFFSLATSAQDVM